MNADSQLVDQIVARVMASLNARATGATGAVRAAPAPTAPETQPDAVPPAAPSRGTEPNRSTGAVLLTDPVITAAILEERAASAREVEVLPVAVLTPSARDWLQARGIRWRRASEPAGRSGPPSSKVSPSNRWILICVDAPPTVERLVSDWKDKELGEIDVERHSCVVAAAERATQTLVQNKADAALMFAVEAEKAACRANRTKGVRAASVTDLDRVDAVARSLKPNLWVIDPSGRSYFELRAACRKLMRGGH